MPDKEKVPVKKERKGETAITPWRPEEYLSSMDRMLADFESRFERLLAPFPAGGWLGKGGRRWLQMPEIRLPYADLIDSGNEYRVVAEVPGIPKEKLDITVTDRDVKIEGESETEMHEDKEGYLRRERGYSKIQRTVAFPEPVVADKAEASLSNGVLELRVPKRTPTKLTKHKVAVK